MIKTTLKIIFCSFFSFSLFFTPSKAEACCGMNTIKMFIFTPAIKLTFSKELLVSATIVAQGQGIQGSLAIFEKGVNMAIKDWGGYIAASIADQEDTKRKAEFTFNEALEDTFGLGINPVNMPYDGLVAGQETAKVFRMDMLPLMGRTQYGTSFTNQGENLLGGGRQVQKDVLDASEKFKAIFVVDPPNGTYTKPQLEAAQRVFTLLADTFPIAWPFDFEEWKDSQIGKDYQGLMLVREKTLEGLRRIAFLNWMEWHLPVVVAPQWYEQMKATTGYTRKPEIEEKPSLRTFHEINVAYFNSLYFSDKALNLTQKGLLQELLKIQAYRNSMKQEILTEWKKISMQIALLNPENMKKIEENMNEIKTVRGQ